MSRSRSREPRSTSAPADEPGNSRAIAPSNIRAAVGPSGPFPRVLAGGLLLALALHVLVCFSPTFGHDWVDWDDTENFIRNPHFRGLAPANLAWMWTTFLNGHYQPLAWMTLGFDYLIWGMDARGYHITNTLLHALNTLAFFWLARLLLLAVVKTAPPAVAQRYAFLADERVRLWTAALAAAWFGAHPLRVEPVAWVTERRDVLSGVFFMAALCAYVNWQLAVRAPLKPHARPSDRNEAMSWAALTAVLFLLCNLSKVIGIVLVPLFFVLDCYPLRRFDVGPRRGTRLAWAIAEKTPFLIVAVTFATVAKLGQEGMSANMSLAEHPLSGRLGVVAYGMVFYLWKTLLPLGLAPLPELHLPVRLSEPRFYLALLACGVLLALLLRLARKRPALGAAAAAYVLLLGPSSGIVQNGWQLVHDRYSYLPLLGLTLVTAAWLSRFACENLAKRVAVIVLALFTTGAFGALTWQQCWVWRNTETLWTHAMRVTPDSSAAQNGYGYILLEKGNPAEAEGHFRRALALRGSNEKAHSNLWEAMKRLSRGEAELRAAYADAVAKLPFNRNATEAHANLANSYAREKRYDLAFPLYERALLLSPGRAGTYYNYGLALLMEGANLAKAEAQLRRATELDPAMVAAHRYLADALVRLQRKDEAIAVLRNALRLFPADAAISRELSRLAPK